MNEERVYRAALGLWGARAQTLMVFEEMAELQKELCKHARGKDNREAIAEEIADVEIMLGQMKILHDCAEAAAACRESKLRRMMQEAGPGMIVNLEPGAEIGMGKLFNLEDVIRMTVAETFKAWTVTAKDDGCIVLPVEDEEAPQNTHGAAAALAVRELGTARGVEHEPGMPEGYFHILFGNLEARIFPDASDSSHRSSSGLIQIQISMNGSQARIVQFFWPDTLEQNFQEEDIYRRAHRRNLLE